MRILANRKIKHLFICILLLVVGFSSISVVAVSLQWKFAALYVLVSAICMGVFIFAALYVYFRKQEQIMENAVTQIREYISGNHDARIDCDDEGELYRLFHEVNALVAILNAHAENEGKAKIFLKDTISNISHQLKTPLAALNIYNGLLQEETTNFPAIREFTDLSEQELDRIETLVQNLLTITKLDAGTIVLEKSEYYVDDMMAQIQRRFSFQAQQQKKNLNFAGQDTVMLICDAHWFMRKAIRRGDLFYADLNPVVGSEQGGIRPVLVIQNDVGNHFSPTVVAAAITSRKAKNSLPTHILLENVPGLAPTSLLLLEQLRTIDRQRLRGYIGRISKEKMLEIDAALAISIGIGYPNERRTHNV